MKQIRILAIALVGLLLGISPVRADRPVWQVCFTPGEDCISLIVAEIAQAQRPIRVQAFSFASTPILQALKLAHGRGVDVRVIVDKTSAGKSRSGSKYTAATYLTNAGIPVLVDTKVSIAHSKVMVIDAAVVITGSFNFTAAAQNHNAENLLVIGDVNLAKLYMENWERRSAVSMPYLSSADVLPGQPE